MKLLIAGSSFRSTEYINKLEEKGIEVIYSEREDTFLSEDQYNVDAVICNWLFVHNPIERFRNLKYIQLLSAGMDRIPLDYIEEKGIIINNARGVYSIPMAEFAVMGVLQLLKRASLMVEQQKESKWNKLRDLDELNNKSVLITGCGSVGTEVAKRFSAFTDYVYGIDAFIPDEYQWFRNIQSIEHLDESLHNADIVILTLPLSNDTHHLFNSERFSHMKNNAILVNISRGGVVDETDLISALKTKLGGAVLDVFEKEPLPSENPLWSMENVLITPHNSFISKANEQRLWELCMSNLEEYIKTEGVI